MTLSCMGMEDSHRAKYATSQVEKELQSVSERRRQRSTARQSFQATYEQAVNTPDFAPVLQAGGCVFDTYPKCLCTPSRAATVPATCRHGCFCNN